MNIVSGLFVVAGAAFAMIGGIGSVRFPDLLSRMHAAAKTPTLGLVLVAIGAAIEIGTMLATTTLILVVILQLLSAPVGAHALSRASRPHVDIALDVVDDLALFRRRTTRSKEVILIFGSGLDDGDRLDLDGFARITGDAAGGLHRDNGSVEPVDDFAEQ